MLQIDLICSFYVIELNFYFFNHKTKLIIAGLWSCKEKLIYHFDKIGIVVSLRFRLRRIYIFLMKKTLRNRMLMSLHVLIISSYTWYVLYFVTCFSNLECWCYLYSLYYFRIIYICILFNIFIRQLLIALCYYLNTFNILKFLNWIFS